MILLNILPATPTWQVALLGCNIVAFATLFLRVVSTRQIKSYPALVSWLGFNIALGFVPLFVHMDVLFYYWFFIAVESCSLMLYLFTVLELYGKVLKGLPGLASTARIVIQVVVPASAIVALAVLGLERLPVVSYLDWFYRIDGTVITTLLFFVLMITGFMVWFPVRIARNTVVYSLGYAAYLLPKAASLFLRNSGHGVMWLSGTVGMIMSTVCLLFWAVTISRTGESAIIVPGWVFHPHDQERLLNQLEEVNRSLSRMSKK